MLFVLDNRNTCRTEKFEDVLASPHSLDNAESLSDHGYCSVRAENTCSTSQKTMALDYSYTATKIDIEDLSLTNQQSVENLLSVSDKREISISIEKQLTQLSKVGHSIVFDNKQETLFERNWFKELVEEMKTRCPELLEILLCAVGKC